MKELSNLLNYLDLLLVPFSCVRYWKKEAGPEDKIEEVFMYAFDGLKLTAETFLIYNFT